jgi:hypothetical protein
MNDFLQSLRNGQAEKPRTPKTRKNADNSYQYTNNNNRFNTYGQGYQNTRNPNMKRQMPPGLPHQGGNQIPAEDPSTALLADILDNISIHVETLVKNQEYMVNIQERTADTLERQAIAIERIVNHLNLSPEMEDLSQPAFKNHYVTSREPKDNLDLDDIADDNIGNGWVAPPVPAVKPIVKPIVEPVAAPVREAKKIRPSAKVEKPVTSKPVLRKRRKIVEKELIAPKAETVTPKATKRQKVAKESKAMDAKLMPRDKVMGIIESMRKEGATFDQVAKRLVDLGQPTFSGRGEWHAQTIHRLCSKK